MSFKGLSSVLALILLSGTASAQTDKAGTPLLPPPPASMPMPMNLAPMPYMGDDNVEVDNKDDIDSLLRDIFDHTGLRSNFVAQAADVPNAMAYMDNSGNRLILYNPRFMRQLVESIGPNWAQLSILLHEVGHHLQGHIFENSGDVKHREIEADEFSGYLMYRMGATLEEATSVASELTDERINPTHPPRSERLAAISTGWNRARVITIHETELAIERDRRTAKVKRGY